VLTALDLEEGLGYLAELRRSPVGVPGGPRP